MRGERDRSLLARDKGADEEGADRSGNGVFDKTGGIGCRTIVAAGAIGLGNEAGKLYPSMKSLLGP